MSNEKSFRLIGEMTDNISPKLRKINANLASFTRGASKEMGRLKADMDAFVASTEKATKAVRDLNAALKNRPKDPFQAPKRADIAALRTYAREVGKATAAVERLGRATNRKGGITLTTRNVVENRTVNTRRNIGGGGGGGGRDDFRGLRNNSGLAGGVISGIIGGQATLLAFGIMDQIRAAVTTAMGFAAQRFREGLEDQIDDVQMQGRTVGRLRIEGLLGNTLDDYRYGAQLTRDIQRQVSKKLANSAADSDLVLRLFKQLSDNFIPALISDPKIRGNSQEGLGERVGEELGTLFERIALMTPQNYDVGYVSRGITKLIEEGKITGEVKRIDFFETNPGLLANINEAEFEAANLTERVRMFNAAMMKVMPEEALTELNNSLGASIRAVRNNLLSIDIGLVSLGADLEGGAYGAKKGQPLAANMLRRQKDGSLKEVEVLVRTPMELINTKLSPALFALGRVLRTITDTFGPLTQALGMAFNRTLGPILNRLTRDLDAMASNLGANSIGEALGQLAGRLGMFALDALNSLTGAGGGFFTEFKKGFDKTMGGGKFNQLIDRITEVLGDAIGRFFTFIIPVIFGAFGKAMQTLVTKGGAAGLVTAGVISTVLISPILSGLAHIAEITRASLDVAARFHKRGLDKLKKSGSKTAWKYGYAISRGKSPEMAAQLQKMGVSVPGKQGGLKGLLELFTSKGRDLGGFYKGLGKLHYLERFVLGLKGASKWLEAFGKSTFVLTGLFSGLARALQGGSFIQILSSAMGGGLGSVLGGAIGFAIAGPIGAAVGSTIGAYLGTLKPVVEAFEGVFTGVWQGIQAVWPSIELALGSFVSIIGHVLNILGDLFKSLFGIKGELSTLQLFLNATRVILTPLVGLLNGISFALVGLKLGLIKLDQWINTNFQGGDRKGRLLAAEKQAGAELNRLADSQRQWNENILKPLEETKLHMTENIDKVLEHTITVDKNGKVVAEATKEISGFTQNMTASSNRMSSLFRMTPGAPGMPGGNPFTGPVPMGSGKIVELGNWLKTSGIAPAGVTEHPSFGGVAPVHAQNSYHYSGRAIDIPAWSFEQGPIIDAIQSWATLNGVQIKELLHAGNDVNHMDHVHVAFARGMGNGRYFGSWQDALSYERHMMPSGTKAVYNSGETASGRTITIGTINVNGSNAQEIANNVAAEILSAVRKAESSTIA